MNKTDLNEISKLKKLLEKEKKNNDFLIKKQTEFKNMAERAGSESAAYRAMVIRLEEEIDKMHSTLRSLGIGE